MPKILLIEDDQMISKMIKLRLSMRSYEIDCAYDGRQGFQKAISNGYDAILLDMNMPIMGGCETAKKLRKEGYESLIIAFTASVLKADTDAAITSGCDCFIAKPIGQDFEKQLESIIQHYKEGQLNGD